MRVPKRSQSSNKGAACELRCAADLLAKGWQVFRSVSPVSTCDVIAMRGETILRIEVRSAAYLKDGITATFPKHQRDLGRSDHYAAVLPDQIVYVPELPV